MPVSASTGEQLARALAEAAAEAELRILERTAAQLAQGIDGDPEVWAKTRLANIQAYRKQVTRDLAALNQQAAAQVEDVVRQGYALGAADALQELTQYAQTLGGLTSPTGQATVRALSQELLGKVRSVSEAVLRQAPDVYQQAVGQAVQQSALGSLTTRQAAQAALSQLTRQGILVAPANSRGQRMALPDYVRMATRTAAGRAAIDGHQQALQANGLDLVTIQLGPRPCDLCDDWGFKVLTLTGSGAHTVTTRNLVTGEPVEVRVEGSLADARAGGWGHPNDRCTVSAFIPGASTPPTTRHKWDQAGYEAQQRQREIERNIRKYKLESASSLDGAAKARADLKVKQWQATQREHLRQHEYLKRQPDRESILKPGSEPEFRLPTPPTPAVVKAAKRATVTDWGKKRTPKYVADDLGAQGVRNLTEDDRAVLVDYVQNGQFESVNAALRGHTRASTGSSLDVFNQGEGDEGNAGFVQQFAGYLDEAISKQTTLSEMTLYRGTSASAVEGFKRGTKYQDHGFVSSTLDPKITADFNTEAVLRISYPQGMPAIYVDAFDDISLGQSEVLLPRDLVFEVTQVQEVDGVRVVSVRARKR